MMLVIPAFACHHLHWKTTGDDLSVGGPKWMQVRLRRFPAYVQRGEGFATDYNVDAVFTLRNGDFRAEGQGENQWEEESFHKSELITFHVPAQLGRSAKLTLFSRHGYDEGEVV
jgi:hypothetical protein